MINKDHRFKISSTLLMKGEFQQRININFIIDKYKDTKLKA